MSNDLNGVHSHKMKTVVIMVFYKSFLIMYAEKKNAVECTEKFHSETASKFYNYKETQWLKHYILK